MKALPNIAGRCARVLVLLAAAGPVAGAEPELDRELRDLNAESAKKWLRFAEKMLQQKNARLALRALEKIGRAHV